ncbi:UNVERIFIED_CONTAM: hypothetical protein HDU68_005783, partial [Siphonaria sp. JEL0065]
QIIAQIKLNSILSEREGKDSFGDPSQRNALHEVVSNLKLCLFHFNGTEIISHARKAHINALSGLQKTISGEKSYNINDLCAIVSHLQCAEDLFYEAHQNAEDILYIVNECRCLWQCGGVLDTGKDVSLVDFKNGKRLLTKQQIDKHCKELKIAVLNNQAAANAEIQGYPSPLKRKLSELDVSSSLSQVVQPTPPKKKKVVSFADDSKDNESSTALPAQHGIFPSSETEPLKAYKLCDKCASNPNPSFQIEGTTCTKLTYIGDQILKYHRDEKIIVYTMHDNEMYAVKEFCELFGIQFRMFMKTKQRISEKSANVNTFNTADAIRVIIMDVTKASFGLDLSAASRIYFMRPVLETAIYKQAIKRAHRLGCVRPVHVEVVAFSGTLEAVNHGENKNSLAPKTKRVDITDLKMKDLIDVAPFVMGAGDESVHQMGLPELFIPHVSFATPFVKTF